MAPALILTGMLPQYPNGSAAWLLLRFPWMLGVATGLLVVGLRVPIIGGLHARRG